MPSAARVDGEIPTCHTDFWEILETSGEDPGMFQNNGGRITDGTKRCAAALLLGLLLACGVNTARSWFAVVPAYADPERITGLDAPLTEGETGSLLNARAFALGKIEGVEGLRILDEPSEE